MKEDGPNKKRMILSAPSDDSKVFKGCNSNMNLTEVVRFVKAENSVVSAAGEEQQKRATSCSCSAV